MFTFRNIGQTTTQHRSQKRKTGLHCWASRSNWHFIVSARAHSDSSCSTFTWCLAGRLDKFDRTAIWEKARCRCCWCRRRFSSRRSFNNDHLTTRWCFFSTQVECWIKTSLNNSFHFSPIFFFFFFSFELFLSFFSERFAVKRAHLNYLNSWN